MPAWKSIKDLCPDNEVGEELKKCMSKSSFENEESLVQWITSAPSLTTLRVIRTSPQEDLMGLKESLESFLIQQSKDRNRQCPRVSFMDSTQQDILVVEPSPGHEESSSLINRTVVIDPICGSAFLRGADIFVKGILGMSASVGKKDLVDVVVGLGGSKCLKGMDPSKLDLSSVNYIRIGMGRSVYSRDQVFKSAPEGVGITNISSPHPSLNLPPGLDTRLFPQNYPSYLTVLALRLNEGDSLSLLDMCASPGGKTLHAAQILGSSGRILAVDKSPNKIACLQKNFTKYNPSFENLTTLVSDGRKLPDLLSEKFDRILVDAPCSALGKRTCLRIGLRKSELLSYPRIQRHLLDSAIQLLKPGGVLVYSTCTITLGENEENVEWLLSKYEDVMELDTRNPVVGGKGFTRFSSLEHIGFFVVAFRKKRD